MTCTACPHPEACAAARCIDDVIAEQRQRFNNLQSVSVMTKWQVRDVIARLSAGDTVRVIIGANVVTLNKLNTHMKVWPLWGASIITMMVANRKAAFIRRADWKRAKTHCKQGHEFTPENTSIKFNGTRQCKTCNRIAAEKGKVLSADEVTAIKTKLKAGIPLGWIAGNAGPDRSHYVANFAAVNRLRREDASFAQFVTDAIAGSNSRGQVRRHFRVQIMRRRQEADDYAMLRALTAHLGDVRDDVINSLYRAMLEGIIKREDVARHVDEFRRMENALAPAKFFRENELRLDAPIRRGGDGDMKLADILVIENDDPDRHVNFSSIFGR